MNSRPAARLIERPWTGTEVSCGMVVKLSMWMEYSSVSSELVEGCQCDPDRVTLIVTVFSVLGCSSCKWKTPSWG